MRSFEFTSPSLDFGSGDGMFSFIRAGGEFGSDFDVFQATTELDQFFNNVDVYDAFDESISPVVSKTPDYQIDVAFDHKENLLKKATTLGLYKGYKVGDGNARLPFDDDSFQTIFSNIVYWLDDPEFVLSELRRILKPGGKICLMLPDKNLPDFSFYNTLHVQTGDPKWAFLERLDRGRFSSNLKQAKSAAQWEALFENAAFTVDSHGKHLCKPIIQMWDIGLRPLFPLLLKMVESLGDNKAEIKTQWVDTFEQFLEPFLSVEDQHNDFGFHCYILT